MSKRDPLRRINATPGPQRAGGGGIIISTVKSAQSVGGYSAGQFLRLAEDNVATGSIRIVPTDEIERARLGNLNGNWGYSDDVYGAAFGVYAAGQGNITIDPDNGLRIRLYSDEKIVLNPDGSVAVQGLSATGATIEGDLTATTGELGDLDVTGALVLGTGGIVKSSNYVAGEAGWQIGADGSAEFQDITARGTLHTVVFAEHETSVVEGTLKIDASDAERSLAQTLVVFPIVGTHVLIVDRPVPDLFIGDMVTIEDAEHSTRFELTMDYAAGGAPGLFADNVAGDFDVTYQPGARLILHRYEGPGHLLLTADDQFSGPRYSVYAKTDSYTRDLMATLGNLNGSYGIADDIFGLGVGDYDAGNYLRYEPGAGFALRAGDGGIGLDSKGLQLEAVPLVSVPEVTRLSRSIRFYVYSHDGQEVRQSSGDTPGYADVFRISAEPRHATLTAVSWQHYNEGNGTWVSEGGGVSIQTVNPDGSLSGYIGMHPNGSSFAGITMKGASEANYGVRIADNLLVEEELVVRRDSADHTGYVVVVDDAPWTSTAWDGDVKTSTNNGTIDLSTAFGLPAGIKGVYISFNTTTTASANDELMVGFFPDADQIPGGASWGGANGVWCQIADDLYRGAQGFVPCDANGDIYFYTTAAANVNVWVCITGYVI